MRFLRCCLLLIAYSVQIFGVPINITGAIPEDAVLSTPELIHKYGYPEEVHHVTTEDGYILEMHRIPHGVTQGAGPTKNKPVVFLMHGFVSTSADWVLLGTKSALGYLLADQGYDVWMGNARGNTYSRKHITLSPGEAKFWNFSWHEIGIYDLPAMIDYVIRKTGQKKIFYGGHSQGSTSFLVMASIKPEYNNKIINMYCMSPIAYMTNLKSPIVQFLANRLDSIEISLCVLMRHNDDETIVYGCCLLLWNRVITKLIGINEFLPNTELVTELGSLFCKEQDWSQFICIDGAFITVGFSKEELRKDLLPVIIAHTPAGSSFRQFIHYAQNIKSKDQFRQYDFGPSKNLIKYDSTAPPSYNISKVTAPMTLFYSLNDWVSSVVDVKKLYNELPNPNGLYLVTDTKFNHYDYMYGKNAKEFVYDRIIKLMNEYKLN